MPFLKVDVVSNFNKMIYARAGDEVVVIADYLNVAIVENVHGLRFSCRKTELAEDAEPGIKAAKIEAKPVRVPNKKTAPLNKQKTLF